MALVLLVGVVASVLTPVKVTLSDIPEAMRTDLDAAAAVRLPSGSGSYKQFLHALRRYRKMAARLTREVSEAQRAFDVNPDAANQLHLAQATQLLADAQANVDLYNSHAESYLEQAEYYGVAGLFSRNRPKVIVLAIIASLGALIFQVSLASAPADRAKSDSPRLAYLVSSPDRTRLWRDLSLDACVIGGKVPVLLASGTGADDNPYRLSLIAVAPGCAPKSFAARATDVTVAELPAADVTINYEG
ncbi:hypothetical protein [Mycolicibacterium cosmeticum]|uniref:hypothetical protein n=1 Tax=Mycolicibacterium cosmeticum TaxID=258533 RepID=UPI003204CFE1